MTAVPDGLWLDERHYVMLHGESGISDAVMRERGYRSVHSKADFEGTEFSPSQRRVGGILIPVWTVSGKQGGWEFRPDEPRRLSDRVIKYEWPRGKGRRFDIPPRCHETLGDPERPLWITEGAKKADALATYGYTAVNIAGVWNWRTRNDRGGIALNTDIDEIPLNGRTVYLCFDSDVSVKVPVKRALQRLAAILARRGARVKIVLIPGTAEYKQGIDDYLVTYGVKGLQRLADEAIDADAGNEPLTPVRLAVKEAPVHVEAMVPRGYRLDRDGVRTLGFDPELNEVEHTVLPAPLVMTHRHRDVDTGDEQATLALLRDDVWRPLTMGREILADARAVVRLAAAGLPVTSNTASALVDYLAAYEATNLAVIPVDLTTQSCGWKRVDGASMFMLGERVLGADATVVRFLGDDVGNRRFVESITGVGEMTRWRGVLETYADRFPRLALGLYAAASSPLLDILNAPGFAIDVAGNSSIGKTAWLEICASVWGLPTKERGGLVKGWDGTKTFMERYAALMAGLPLFFDESQLADPRYLARIVYSLTNGEGRGRGSISGLRVSGSWRPIVFSTGEHPLAEASQDQGLRARTLLLWGSPFGGPDQGESVRTVATLCRTNYGWGGPLIVQWLLDHRAEWPALRSEYEQTYANLITAASGGNLADRYASYFAVMLIGARIAHEAWGVPGNATAVLEGLYRESVAEVEESNYGERARDAVVSWAMANRASFYGSHDQDRRPKEFFGAWGGPGDDLSIYEFKLKEFLRTQGFTYEATLRTWRDKGWLRIQADGRRFGFPRRIDGAVQRLPTLTAAFVAVEDDEW
jgi:uncharacterized protein (DUF927 family)